MIERPLETPLSPKTWSVGTLTYTAAGLVAIFFWLLFGDFAWSMRDRSVGPMASWYLESLKVSNLWFGLILSSFPAFVGMILGPVISVKSDRHRGRWGRRIPFLLVTTPLAAVGMLGIAWTPVLAQWIHGRFPEQNHTIVTVVSFGMFWAAFECATIAGAAIFGGLINDVVPPHLLGRFYGLFRAVSLIDGMIFNYWIMGKVPVYYTLILTVIGIFYGVTFMLVCFKVKEGDYPPPTPRDSQFAKGPAVIWREIRQYARECFANPYYVSIFFMAMFANLAFSPVNIFALPYAKSLGMDMDTYGKYLALTYLISLCLAFFLGWLADAFHPLRVALAMLFGYLLVTVWASIFATTQSGFVIAWVLHGVLSGCFFTTAASLGQRLFPREKYSQFSSAAGLVSSAAFMSIGPLVGMIIDTSGNVYRYTFVTGAGLAVIGLTISIFVYRRFLELGGHQNYQAPL